MIKCLVKKWKEEMDRKYNLELKMRGYVGKRANWPKQ